MAGSPRSKGGGLILSWTFVCGHRLLLESWGRPNQTRHPKGAGPIHTNETIQIKNATNAAKNVAQYHLCVVKDIRFLRPDRKGLTTVRCHAAYPIFWQMLADLGKVGASATGLTSQQPNVTAVEVKDLLWSRIAGRRSRARGSGRRVMKDHSGQVWPIALSVCGATPMKGDEAMTTPTVTIPLEEYDALRADRAALAALEEQLEDLADVCAGLAAKAEAMATGDDGVPLAVMADLIAADITLPVWRKYRQMTQRELSQASGVSRVHISDIERGKAKGSIATLKKLAAALRCQLDDLT